ncbi:Integrase catalytic domain-containing protein [Citrus sinensis]|uniref:Integrase catalytic domain-containing protein n=1 Tax=Citrus sinensis TaxID=2711 RepID=A0ACB8M200_CITSI|nr:Integrase catalytic domain-containing protein [Citrus sinensis]
MSSSRGSSNNFFYKYKEEKLQVNGKVIKFRNKLCTDYGERVTIKISEYATNPKRLYYKCKRPCYDYFRWWEPSNFEYKVITRGLGGVPNAASNVCPTSCLFAKPLAGTYILTSKHNTFMNIMSTPATVDGSVGVAAGVDVGVVLNGVAKPLGCTGVFVFGLEAKTFIPRYDAPELEAATKVTVATGLPVTDKRQAEFGQEGQSTTRPPYFDGKDYPYWKTRMRIYLQALDYEIWEIVNDGPFMPLTKNEVGEDIPKPSRDWNEFEKRKASLNSKAMNALFCALDKKEFHRVSSCESANEIWHKLEVVYEGTNQVKESKISRYTRQYELFQMEQNENVYSMYTRFTDIVNTLGALGKTFSNSEKVKKIIRSLPKEWRPKRTAIEEAKDLNVLPIDDLIGSLISYEEDLAAEKGHEEKKKNIALKASKRESDDESEMDDEELAMLARRFRKFYKKNNEQRKFRGYKNKKEKKEPITCYECKKPGHIRPECPLLNKFKKKAMVATWDDSDEETSDDDEQQEMTNLALMAIGEESCDELDEGSKKKKNKWYLDSGCSRHMTGNYSWFSSFTKIENGGDVSFGDNSRGKIIGIGNVGNVSSTLIENVCLVENLKHNLLSISQLCDKGYRVIFDESKCVIENACDGKVLFVGNRCVNVYTINIDCASTNEKCLSALHDDGWLWHRRLGHASMDLISKIVKNDLVKGLPKINFQKDRTCEACQFGKQIKTSFKSKNHVSTSKPLQLLHIDLFGPSRYASLSGKFYACVIVDDYSRYTWVLFLANKDDAIDAFRIFCKKVQNEKGYSITCIRSDHGGEFENHAFENFCNDLGIEHQFSSPRTPQQNGVVERKNRSIQEMARTMLNENSLPKYFWTEAVNTACYVLNRVLIRPNLNKTPYELWKDRKPNIGYFKVFGCKCFVLNTKDNLGKFDPKSDVGIFLGYSNSSKAYRVYNKRTLVVEESMHVTFDESNPSSTEKVVVDDNAEEEQQEEASNDNQEDTPPGIQEEHHEETNAEQNEGTSQTLPKEWRYVSSHPKDVILGDPSRGVTTRSSLRNTCEHAAFISQIEPKSFADTENDESWIMAMQEELNQFERNNVWELVPNPEHQSIIDFSSCMSQEFEMSMMGELKYFLGLQIKQNEEGIFINQAKYVKDLLKRFGYENGTAKSTPMSTTIKLDKDEKGKEVDIKTYRGMIGSLLYLTASRPDIMFSVCLCARFQSCPKESHMLAVKHIFRYLIGTINLGLWYPRGTHIDLTCYSDADFAGYKISHRTLFQLLGDVGWIDALLIEENVYPDLVKVFYSNMDCSAEKENRVITKVGGVLIEFDDSDLNNILGSSDDGLDIFSLRKPPEIDDYVHVDAVRNICRRHLDEVSHMDVAMIECILRGRPVDLGYSIVRTMLSIPALITRSLPYGHFITRILKFFEVPILEPSCRPSKGIGDEVIVGLGFEWQDGTWVKYSDNKFTFLAPSDDRPLNAVFPADQLPVFSLSFRGQRRRRVSSTVASAPSASASASSPPRPPTSGDVTLQQLMDEVRTLSVRQTELQQQQQQQRQLQQQQQRQLQQQLIHGQRLLFEHFGIPYPFPPPSSPPE